MTPNTANPPLPGAMPGRTPENAQAPADFKPLDVAKSLLRATRTGTLATLDRNSGYPFASLVNIATDIDGAPLLGEHPSAPGFFYAVTSNGSTLGPAVGRTTAELITKGRAERDISQFGVERFRALARTR